MYSGSKRLSLVISTLLISLFAILPGCGGGSSPDATDNISTGRTGVAVDPYIVGAVFEEIPAKGGSALQESTPSDKRGEFVFALPLTEGSLLRMKDDARGMHNGLPYGSILKRVVEGGDLQVVSPLTTLLANGVRAEEILSVLADAGVHGLQVADLRADPMARMKQAAVLDAEALLPLQANITVNALFTLGGNSDLTLEDLTSRRGELAEIAEAVRNTVSKEVFDHILTKGGPAILGNAGSIGRDHAIRAMVSIIDTVVEEKMADQAVDAITRAASLLPEAADLALIHFIKENRGHVSIEEGIDAGVLPDVQEGDTVYLELAKWKWKRAPIADAGPDQNVATGDLVTLDGSRSSDPDHHDDSLKFQWSFAARPSGSQATLSGANTVNPTFTADVEGMYRINLTVFDNWGGASAPDSVTVTATGSTEPAPTEPTEPPPTLSAPGVIQFSSDVYSVEENAGKIDIPIHRVNGSTGEVSVQWRTRTHDGYGTADWSTDYGTVDWTTITFAAGQTSRTVSVQIHDNNVVDGDKTFSVLLRNPTGGAVLGDPTRATVTILDNDVASDPEPAPQPEPEPEPAPSGPLKAIPGIFGFGVETPGGRGGVVIRVNTLNDNNNPLTLNADGTRSGSLRAALNHNGRRIIVFEVSGRINLGSELVVTRPFVTIAGQTAPPPGITIYGNAFRIATNDVVMQHIRVRPNNNTSAQLNGPLGIQDYHNNIWNVVIDRCTFGWGADENIAIWASSGRTINDITINNSIIHESIRPSGQDSYGMIFGDRVKRIMTMGNLMVSNRTRNPLYKGGSEAIFANNIVYNAALGAFVLFSDDYNSGAARASVVNNIFKRGPSGSPSEIAWFAPNTAGKGFRVYQAGNVSRAANGNALNLSWGSTAPSGTMVSSPPIWIDGLSLVSSSNLEATLLSRVGARAGERGTSHRDANDVRLINEYQSGTGAIPGSGYLYPAPSISGQTRAFPLPANPNGIAPSGYTNIEEVLHKMARDVQ